MMRRSTAALAALAGLAMASGAEAHAHLVSSTPAADATVAAPKSVTLKFSEKLMPRFSTLALAGPGGEAPAAVKVKGDTLTATPSKPLAAGAYTATWTVVSADTHKVDGHIAFTVK